VRCLYAKLPKSSPAIANFRRNIRNYPNANLEDIKDYTYQYAINAFTDEEIWINFDEVISATPLKEVKNQTEFLESSTFSETSEEDFLYFLKILEYKISDDLSPLEFIREDIENIIINKRKIALKKELEEAIYDEALENQSFEIYSR
ncbi:MAG: peptidyl-prolyl cis-trans isomerase, partial [Bacteroidota bacterium]